MHTGRATGHNGIQVELYKYSEWARSVLRSLLKQVWESGIIPEKMVTGVATMHFKSGNQEVYTRYRILDVFPAEYKILTTIMLKRIVNECIDFLRDWMSGFLAGRGTADNQYLAKQFYRLVCQRRETAVALHVDSSTSTISRRSIPCSTSICSKRLRRQEQAPRHVSYTKRSTPQ